MKKQSDNQFGPFGIAGMCPEERIPLAWRLEFIFGLSTASPPARGEIRFNAATIATTTAVWVYAEDSDGKATAPIFSAA